MTCATCSREIVRTQAADGENLWIHADPRYTNDHTAQPGEQTR